MLFVCFAHFGEVFFARRGQVSWLLAFRRIGMIASPTFMMISGAMLGFLWRRSGGDDAAFANTRARLRRRALFLLTFGHVLLMVSCIPFMGVADALKRLFITDTVAFNLLAGTALIGRTRPRTRLAAATVMFLGSFVVAYAWQPATVVLTSFQEVVFGTIGWQLGFFTDVFPVIPWFAIYLGATTLGEELARADSDSDLRRLAPRLCALGAFAVVAMAMVKTALHLLRGHVTHRPGLWTDLVDPLQKLPPGPVYLCVFGGAGLVLLSVVFYMASRHAAPRVTTWLASWGRSSMTIFILQSFMYFFLYSLFHPRWSWAPAFGVSLLGIEGAFRAWRYLSGLVGNRRISFNAVPRS